MPCSHLRALTRSGNLLGALLGVALGACTGGEPPDPPVADLAIGSAEPNGTGYVEVTPGQDVELIPGAQGGFHVWINVSVHGAAGGLYIEHEARRTDEGTLVLRGLPRRFDVPDDAMSEWWESPDASPAFMCPTPIGVQVFDHELTFTVRLRDGDGEDAALVAEDQVVLVPRCPEGDQNAFCHQICAG